jgi:polyisoprenoid-binding protein YceI
MRVTLSRGHWGATLWTIALLLGCTVSAASLQAETVTFDPAGTSIDFTLGDVLHTVHGAFTLQSGVIHFDPETGKASGSLVVDATSGASGSGGRDRRMHKNILESERYPEIVFTPDAVEGKIPEEAAGKVQVHGVFRIHGVDHKITLPFQVQRERDQITASTRFPLPYVKWGLKNPSTFLIKVSETVEISIRAVGRFSGDRP